MFLINHQALKAHRGGDIQQFHSWSPLDGDERSTSRSSACEAAAQSLARRPERVGSPAPVRTLRRKVSAFSGNRTLAEVLILPNTYIHAYIHTYIKYKHTYVHICVQINTEQCVLSSIYAFFFEKDKEMFEESTDSCLSIVRHNST